MALTGNHTARIAILAVASVLAIVSIFPAWWTLHVESGGADRDTSARPFHAGDFADDDEDGEGLDSEVIVTGILAVLAALAATAFLVLELLPAMGHAAQPLPRLLMAFLSTALGLSAILYTAFSWPQGTGGEMSFFDETSFNTGGAFGSTSGSITTYAGLGWWLALVATIVLPLVAFLVGLREDAPSKPIQNT